MKEFNRAVNQQIIHGHVVPTGAFYGKIALKFSRKVRTGKKYVVTDKDGYTIFDADGKPVERNIFRLEKCCQTVLYSIEKTKLYKDEKGRLHFYAYISYDNNDGILKWHEEILGGSSLTKELERFIAKRLALWLNANNKTWESLVINAPCVKTPIHAMVPQRKKAQTQFIYRGYGYAIRSDIINEDVKPKMAIIHTNMDKCHPINEREIYHSHVSIKSKKTASEKHMRHVIAVSEDGKAVYKMTKTF